MSQLKLLNEHDKTVRSASAKYVKSFNPPVDEADLKVGITNILNRYVIHILIILFEPSALNLLM